MIAWPCRLITLQWAHRLAALSLNSAFPSSAYEAFFLLLHSHLSFPHLTAREIVRSCRAYKISPKKCIAILSICIHSQGTQRKLQINYYSGDYLVLLSNWPGTHSIAFNWLKKNHPGCPTNLLQPNIFDYGNEMKCGSHRRPSFPFFH